MPSLGEFQPGFTGVSKSIVCTTIVSPSSANIENEIEIRAINNIIRLMIIMVLIRW